MSRAKEIAGSGPASVGDAVTHDLAERVKELTLLHEVARLLQPGPAMDETLLGTLARLLPPAWQHPDTCEARVTYGETEARTPGFRPTPWMQAATFTTSAGHQGGLEIAYLEERAGGAEGPFLPEELRLIQSVADMLRIHAERKQAEGALKTAEERFAALFQSAPVGMLITSAADARIIETNAEFEAITGYSRKEAVGRATVELGFWANEAVRDEHVAAAREWGGTLVFDREIPSKHGTRVPVRVSSRVIELGGVMHVLSAFVDVSDQKRAEASIRASEARLRRVVESPILGFAFHAPDGVVEDANDEFLRIVGRTREEVAEGRLNLRQITPPEHLDRTRRVTEELESFGTARPWEMELLKPDGARVPVLIGVSRFDDPDPQRFSFVFDLTERHGLQRQLEQSQRLEAVGRLAAGIAHDFNNVLSTINMSSELLGDAIPAATLAAECLDEIKNAVERAASLTRQLLAFSRQQVMEPRVLDLNDLVAEMERMTRRVIGGDVRFQTRYAVGIGAVRADPGQLQQVILNLAVNARDAMPRGGDLTIETLGRHYDAPAPRAQGTIPAGSYVVMSVTDSGVGMDAPTKQRIFEPFYTTKEPGKGTGLGLSMVHGIVQQSGGFIDVESAPGKGTRFSIFLPRVDEQPAELSSGVRAQASSGSETILLVEDDAPLRRSTRLILVKLGYRVLEAAGPKEACDIATSYAGPIHMLLSDMVMPDMNGRLLAERLVPQRSGLSVLLMSGYTEDALVREGSASSGFDHIQKPFSSTDLALTVRRVLDKV